MDNESVGSASSSDTERLMTELKNAKRIADEGSNNKKLLECLESKVNELLHYKQECISLNSQLKIVKQRFEITQTEFSYQKDQYEKEIQRMKDIEISLRKALVEAESKGFKTTYNVDARVHIDEVSKLNQMVEKLKSNNSELKKNYKEALALNQMQAEEITTLKKELKSSKQQTEEVQNKLIEQETQLSEEQKYIKRIQHLQNRVDRRDKVIKDLESKITEQKQIIDIQNSQDSTQAPEINPDLETERLKARLQRSAKQLERAKEVEKKCNELSKLLDHYNVERDVLYDILQCDIDDPEDEWTNLRIQVREGMDKAQQVAEMSEMLRSLERQITENQKEKESYVLLNQRIHENDIQLAKMDQLSQKLAKTEQDLITLKKDTETIRYFSDQQRIRSQYSKIISANLHNVIVMINQLFTAITGHSETQLRPLLLSVLFLNRWKKLRPSNTDFDQSSLVSFVSIPKRSIETKLQTVNEIFLTLSNDLLQEKSKRQRLKTKFNTLKQEIISSGGEYETCQEQTKKAKIELKFMEKRMKDFQKETAILIKPDKYQEVLTKNTEFEMEIVNLKDEIESMKTDIEQKSAILKELTRKFKEYELRHEKDEDEIRYCNKIIEDKNMEVELLNAKLSERTKELLALERITAINDDLAVEEPKIISKINPSFLGKQVV